MAIMTPAGESPGAPGRNWRVRGMGWGLGPGRKDLASPAGRRSPLSCLQRWGWCWRREAGSLLEKKVRGDRWSRLGREEEDTCKKEASRRARGGPGSLG